MNPKKPKRQQPQSGKYENSGTCFYCRMPLEAIQPGGLEPRHAHSGLPYARCAAALKENAR